MITVNDIIFLASWPAAVVALFSLIDSQRTWVVRMGIVAIVVGLCGGAFQVLSGGRSQWPMAWLSFGCLLYFGANWWRGHLVAAGAACMPLLGADHGKDDASQGDASAGDEMHGHGHDNAGDGRQGSYDGGKPGTLVLGDLDGGGDCGPGGAGHSAVIDAR